MKVFALLAAAFLADDQIPQTPQVSNQVPVVTNHTDIVDNQVLVAL